MSSPSRTRPVRRSAPAITGLIVLALSGLGTMLAGCSDIYFDRRETVALGADDHIATNRVAQMIDPWPPYVGKRQIAFDGQKMQSAVERYRNNRVIPPVNVTTSSTAYQAAEQAAAASVTPSGSATSAAPVK
jgi:hypothetical protein